MKRMKRKPKKPKIHETKYYVMPKPEDEEVRNQPEGIHTELTIRLSEIALATLTETSHNPYFGDNYIQGMHTRCDLKDRPNVQHIPSCPEHTRIYVLPEDVSVRINPVMLRIGSGEYDHTYNPETDKGRIFEKKSDEICEDVTVRYAGKDVPEYLVDILESMGDVEERIENIEIRA